MLSHATGEDATRLAQILGEWICTTPWMPKLHTPEGNRRFLARLIEQDETLVRVARNGEGAAVGFLARQGAKVDCLYVADEARGQGHGSALIAEAQAERPSLELWTFQQNAGAIRFYRRAGFTEQHRTDGANNAERLPDIRMTWQRQETPA